MSMLVAVVGAAALATQDGQLSVPDTRQMMADYAACLVRTNPRQAKLAVLSDKESSEALARADAVLTPDCLPAGAEDQLAMRTWPVLIRFALAQALINRESRLSLPPLEAISRLDHGTVPKDAKPPAKIGVAMSIVGECVVRAAPEAATQLVRSKVASAAEATAFESLKPTLSGCLSAGQTFAFSAEMLRGTVALNYYRLAAAARAGR